MIDSFAALVSRHAAPESLTAAAMEGDIPAVEAFLAAGANIEEKSVGFSSPLHAAAGAGRVEVVNLLLAKGASADFKPGSMYSPLSAAATWAYKDIFRTLLAAATTVSEERAALITWASYGQLEEVKALVERGAEKLGRYAIAAAAKEGHYDVVKWLIDRGIEWKEYTALRIPETTKAAGHDELHKYLMGEPYDETAATERGHLARDSRAAALAKQVAGVAAKRKPVDSAERESLLSAAREHVVSADFKGHRDLASVETQKFGKVTPLIAAAIVGDPGLVEAILAAGAKPAPRLKGGLAAKGLARGPARAKIVALLEGAAQSAKKARASKPC